MAYLNKNTHLVKEKEFLARISEVAAKFYDMKKNLDHVLIVSHSDADGYACGIILQKMAAREKIPTTLRIFSRSMSWTDYFAELLPHFDQYENLAVFISDLGSEIGELSGIFKEERSELFILDHHGIEDYNPEELSENINILNTSEYGYDGLKEIAGSALCYLFSKEVSLKNIENAWIALIGISNDTLMRYTDYQSFNRQVLEEAIAEEQIIYKDSLWLFGSSYDKIKNALAYSVFPFLKQFEGNPKKSEEFLEKLGIDPNIILENLTPEQIDLIDANTQQELKSKIIIFPKKKSILRYAFEHGFIVGTSHFKHPNTTVELFSKSSAPAEFKKEFRQYTMNLTKNLSQFVKTPKEYTDNAIFVDAGKRISSNYWSEVASYSSVNHLYNKDKILFMGGMDGNVVKLSVRCSEFYPPLKDGIGVDTVINTLRKKYGGKGGGHKLAGGYKLAPNRYRKMKKEIDSYFPLKTDNN